MKLRTIRDTDFNNKRVLVRVDFNVPIYDGRVKDDSRIVGALPTIVALLKAGAKVILCSHLGRPKGRVDEELRLTPVVPVLRDTLNYALVRAGLKSVRLHKLSDCVGEAVEREAQAMDGSTVLLLENLRFHKGEEQNDPEFAKQLAALADAYVSDAFGTVHRAHASTEGIAQFLPSYAGLLVEREVEAMEAVVANPKRPLTVIQGGVKISDKLEVLEHLMPLADNMLIGGAMANTFLRAQGFETGRSVVEDELLDVANSLLLAAGEHNTNLLLPTDLVVTDSLDPVGPIRMVLADELGPDDIAADIGVQTRMRFSEMIADSRTVFWNGPMGIFEKAEFASGTLAIAKSLAAVSVRAHTAVGGGESVQAVHQAGVEDKLGHVSTGGGAVLEFVAGRELPGLKVLEG